MMFLKGPRPNGGITLIRYSSLPLPSQTTGYPLFQLNESMQRLQVEHGLLQSELDAIVELSRHYLATPESSPNYAARINQLRCSITQFRARLEEHAEWEESILFPMIAWYLDDEPVQFTLIEQEHELADQYLLAFIETAERVPVRTDQSKPLSNYLMLAAQHLKLHFEMEEELMTAVMDQSQDV